MTSVTGGSVSRIFRVSTIVTLILMLAGISLTLSVIVLIWIPGDLTNRLFADDFSVHRFHAGMISISAWVLFLSVAGQLRKPQKKIATMILAVAALVISIPADLQAPTWDSLELIVLGLLIVMLWFHPGRIRLSWRPLNRPAGAMAAIGAVPWLIYGWNRFAEQLNGVGADRHLELGHYGMMAATTVVILTAVFIGITSLPGSRIAMMIGAGSAAAAGIVSILLPVLPSSLGISWGAAAIVWSGALLVTTWRMPSSPAEASSGSAVLEAHSWRRP